ncbi:uncharacterized protein LOC117325652 isoform X2 [Pecten maximus]|uniref:uncharacterized protein LOC117325652 isoform X2 n=1 Tax=Pecten maximus TaxID=6579 RepID=UPI00145853B8|nr:uncharacterized protein LOC117325652 isoform X2 [Pecten maximus]
MTSACSIEVIVHEMCVDIFREALAEMDKEDMQIHLAEPSPVPLFVSGNKKPQLLLSCPAKPDTADMFTSKCREFLPRHKTYCDVSAMRDVSMTKCWIECSPDMEDQNLRQKHKQRVDSWRNLLTINNTKETLLPCVFRYKATKSLLDFICPMKKTRTEEFEIIDLNDIIPKIVINFSDGVKEARSQVTCKEMSRKSRDSSTKRRNRFPGFSIFCN